MRYRTPAKATTSTANRRPGHAWAPRIPRGNDRPADARLCHALTTDDVDAVILDGCQDLGNRFTSSSDCSNCFSFASSWSASLLSVNIRALVRKCISVTGLISFCE